MLEKMRLSAGSVTAAKAHGIKHAAITMEASKEDLSYAAAHKAAVDDMYSQRNKTMHWLIDAQAKLDIPILTIHLLPCGFKEPELFPAVIDSLVSLFTELSINPAINKQQVKVSVLGKWYDLPAKLIDAIRQVTDATKDFDRFFLNLCINYSGQEEIVDACRLVLRKAVMERIDPAAISRQDIKENIYSSYFIPPQLIIKNGDKKLGELLLWDSAGASIYFTGKPWQEFNQKDLMAALSITA